MSGDAMTRYELQSARLAKIADIIRAGFTYPSDLQDHRNIADFLRNEKLFNELSILAHNWRRAEGIEPYPTDPEPTKVYINPEPQLRKGWLRSSGRYGGFTIRISDIIAMSEVIDQRYGGRSKIVAKEGQVYYSFETLAGLEEKLKRG